MISSCLALPRGSVKHKTCTAGLMLKKRANHERSDPTCGGLSLLEGDGDKDENSESSEWWVIMVVSVRRQ